MMVTWEPNQEPEVTGYKVNYVEHDGTQRASVDVDANKSHVDITGLQIGGTYLIAVIAISPTFPSDPSEQNITIGSTQIQNLFQFTALKYHFCREGKYLYNSFSTSNDKGRKEYQFKLYSFSTEWCAWFHAYV